MTIETVNQVTTMKSLSTRWRNIHSRVEYIDFIHEHMRNGNQVYAERIRQRICEKFQEKVGWTFLIEKEGPYRNRAIGVRSKLWLIVR